VSVRWLQVIRLAPARLATVLHPLGGIGLLLIGGPAGTAALFVIRDGAPPELA